jgi:hypothetical protein
MTRKPKSTSEGIATVNTCTVEYVLCGERPISDGMDDIPAIEILLWH